MQITNKKELFWVTKLNKKGIKSRNSRYQFIINSSLGTNHIAFEDESEYTAWKDTFKLIKKEDSYQRFSEGDCFTLEGPDYSCFCIPRHIYDNLSTFKDVVFLNNGYIPSEYVNNKHSYLVIDSEVSNGAVQECKRFYICEKHSDKVIHIVTVKPYQDKMITLDHGIKYMYAKSKGGFKVDNYDFQFKYGPASVLKQWSEDNVIYKIITIPSKYFNSIKEVTDLKHFMDVKEFKITTELYKGINYIEDGVIKLVNRKINAKTFHCFVDSNDYVTHSISLVPDVNLYI